jgi:hypothetical protein
LSEKLAGHKKNIMSILASSVEAPLTPADEEAVYVERIDRLEHLKRELSHLNKFELETLMEKSKLLQPFKLRRQKLAPPFNKSKCLIDYTARGASSGAVTVFKDEDCSVEDNTLRAKWRVVTSRGVTIQVPSVCFMLCVLDEESFDAAEELKSQCSNMISQTHSCLVQYRKGRLFGQMNRIKFYECAAAGGLDPQNELIELEGLLLRIKLDIDELVGELAEQTSRVQSSVAARMFSEDVSLLMESYEMCCAKLDEMSNQFKMKGELFLTFFL